MFKVGQRVKWSWNDFDGSGFEYGVITEIMNDGDIIIKTDSGLTLCVWDKDTLEIIK